MEKYHKWLRNTEYTIASSAIRIGQSMSPVQLWKLNATEEMVMHLRMSGSHKQ